MTYERKPFELKQKEIDKAIKHAAIEFPREACGVFTRSSGYIPCTNIDPNPEENFNMLEYPQIAANEDDIIALFHSHPNGNNEPSSADMEFQISTNIPWGVAVFNNSGQFQELFFWGSNNIPSLIGRKYRSGSMDCYSIIKDAYKLWYDIELPEFPRDEAFWERGENKYINGFGDAGFELITPEKLMPGDVILGSIRGRGIVNHGAVVYDEKTIIHHLCGELSRRDNLSRWFRHLNICLRHKAFKSNGAPIKPPKLEG